MIKLLKRSRMTRKQTDLPEPHGDGKVRLTSPIGENALIAMVKRPSIRRLVMESAPNVMERAWNPIHSKLSLKLLGVLARTARPAEEKRRVRLAEEKVISRTNPSGRTFLRCSFVFREEVCLQKFSESPHLFLIGTEFLRLHFW